MARKAKDSDIVNKSVTFDRNDPDQNADLKHAQQRTNFSAYVRTLIRMDRMNQFYGQFGNRQPIQAQEEEIDQESAEGFV